MPKELSQLPEFADLCHQLRDQMISKEDFARLEQMILSDEAARKYYQQYMTLHSGLHQIAQLQSLSAGERVVLGYRLSKSASANLRWWLGLAASLLVALLGTIYVASNRNQDDPLETQQVAQSAIRPAASDAPVAVLVDARKADWGRSDLAGASGVPLRKGWLELTSGSAVIEFNSGALVTLEGPAKLRLFNGRHAYLEHGQLAASVPDRAIGFRVDSPTIQLTDLGTEFHIDAAEDGTTEVHVLDGEVEVRPDVATDDTRALKLRKNQAFAFKKKEFPKKIAFKKQLRRKAPSSRERNRIGVYTFDSIGSGTEQDPWVTHPGARAASVSGVRFHDFSYQGVEPGPTEFKENLNRWSFKAWHPEYSINDYYVAVAVETQGEIMLRLNQLALQVFRAGGETETTFAPRDGLLCASSDGFKSFTEFVLLDGFSDAKKPRFKTVDLSSLPPARRYDFRFVFKGPSKARAIRLDEVTLDVDIDHTTD